MFAAQNGLTDYAGTPPTPPKTAANFNRSSSRLAYHQQHISHRGSARRAAKRGAGKNPDEANGANGDAMDIDDGAAEQATLEMET